MNKITSWPGVLLRFYLYFVEARHHYNIFFATITTTNSSYVFLKKMKIMVVLLLQGGFATRRYLPDLMPSIVNILDGPAVVKREAAVSTLGQVVQSTGYVTCYLCSAVSNVLNLLCWEALVHALLYENHIPFVAHHISKRNDGCILVQFSFFDSLLSKLLLLFKYTTT